VSRAASIFEEDRKPDLCEGPKQDSKEQPMTSSPENQPGRDLSRRDFVRQVGLASAATAVSMAVPAWAVEQPATPKPQFVQAPLPYALNALDPWISARTLDIHYNKHHKAYVDRLNGQLAYLKLSYPSLEALIRDQKGAINMGEAIYTMAVLSWNHDWYWKSMMPDGGVIKNEKLKKAMLENFGSLENFRTKFMDEAMKIGVGWVWLVKEGTALKVTRTEYHESPLVLNQTPLLACDVWEHAYYLDYQNRRDDYVNDWLSHIVNWEFAAKNLGV
jgi:superoxide dismutase, Fe-Mn family